MRDRALAVLLTLVVFAAGFGAGIWEERHSPLPPPPGPFMGELGGRRALGASGTGPLNRAELSEQLAKIRPEMDAFRAHINEIYTQFDHDISTVLTPEQQALYEKKFKSLRSLPAPGDDKTLSDADIERLLQRPFRTLYYFIVLPMTLERMSSELSLNDAQREKVKDFLRVRREKFIELVDNAPPPSLMLSRLAPVEQRLAQPTAAPAH
jgi:hypothetical protein